MEYRANDFRMSVLLTRQHLGGLDLPVGGVHRLHSDCIHNAGTPQPASRSERCRRTRKRTDETGNGVLVLQPGVGRAADAQHRHDGRKWHVD